LGVNDRCWVVERDEAEHLSLAKSVRSDFADFDSYQKIIRFCPDGHELLTIGNDDKVRLWHFPWMNMTTEFTLPRDDSVTEKDQKAEDADYDQTGHYIAILSPSAIHIRSRKEGAIVASISPKAACVFRCVRFLKEERAKSGYLVTIENGRGNQQPILSLWKTNTWTRYKSVTIGSRLRATCLSVSENGKMIAFGAADGTVAVYDNQLYVIPKSYHPLIIDPLAILL
jgi:WD40 repeat protein